MDILQISAFATLAIAEFFKSAVSEFGKKAIGELLELVKNKFRNKESKNIALENLAKSPDDKKSQTTFQEQIASEMQTDEKFAQLIAQKIAEIEKVKNVTFTNNIGKVENFFQINQFDGDINIGRNKK